MLKVYNTIACFLFSCLLYIAFTIPQTTNAAIVGANLNNNLNYGYGASLGYKIDMSDGIFILPMVDYTKVHKSTAINDENNAFDILNEYALSLAAGYHFNKTPFGIYYALSGVVSDYEYTSYNTDTSSNAKLSAALGIGLYVQITKILYGTLDTRVYKVNNEFSDTGRDSTNITIAFKLGIWL